MGAFYFRVFLAFFDILFYTLYVQSYKRGNKVSKLKHDISVRFAKLINIVMVTLPFIGCWFLYYDNKIENTNERYGDLIIIALFVLFYIIFARVYDAFLISLNRISEMIYSQALAILISDAIIFLIMWVISEHFPNPLPGLITLAIQLGLTIIWSVLAHKGYYKTFKAKKSLIIFGYRIGMENLFREYGLEKKFDIQKSVHIDDCINNLSLLNGYEAVFISGIKSHERNTVLKHCIKNDICVYVLPKVGDLIMSSAKKMHMFHLPVLRVERYHPHPETRLIKRIFDILVSLIIIILTSPVMLVTALAIKFCDGGPIFYKQERLTKDGKVFKIIKFRSMRTDAEKDGVARLSSGDKDNRITPVGKIIRKLRIDELPQMFNILSGNMSLVGPRPERPQIAKQYEEFLPEFALRLQAKAGLTGYAQVYGKYNTTPYDKLQMDLMYISNPSLMEDLRIIFATIKILFLPDSTDGIAENQTTALQNNDKEEEKEEIFF